MESCIDVNFCQNILNMAIPRNFFAFVLAERDLGGHNSWLATRKNVKSDVERKLSFFMSNNSLNKNGILSIIFIVTDAPYFYFVDRYRICYVRINFHFWFGTFQSTQSGVVLVKCFFFLSVAYQ